MGTLFELLIPTNLSQFLAENVLFPDAFCTIFNNHPKGTDFLKENPQFKKSQRIVKKYPQSSTVRA